MKNKFLSIIAFVLILFSCSSSKKTENFNSFLDKFHNDTAFQLSRITFPLEGGRFYEENVTITPWKRDNWELLKVSPKDIDTSIFTVVSDSSQTSYSYIIGTLGLKITEHYELVNGEWFLVYYEDISN